MTRQDLIIATIRTAVPGAVGYLLALLIGAIPAVREWIDNIDLLLQASAPGTTVVALLNVLVVGLAIAAYYWLARELGRRVPALEKWLLGRSATPSYIDAGTAGATPSVVTHVAVGGSLGYAATVTDGGASHEIPYTDLDGDEPKHRAE